MNKERTVLTFMQWLNEVRHPGFYFGWMTPSGEFIETDMLDHVKAALTNPSLRKYLGSWVDQSLKKVNKLRKQSQKAIANDDHPEWHNYEMENDDFNREVVTDLYRAGCLRVGTIKTSYRDPGIMEFEGSPQAIQNLMQICKDLAESYGMTEKFLPKRWL